ncbi:MAG TPA: DUF6282 family protein [Phycisphaerae bacterium]|nr:DUF6282 family protein [Phycisphaerae bacterium]
MRMSRRGWMAVAGGAVGATLAGAIGGWAQTASTRPAGDDVLKGVIDFHCHSGPDVIGRSINDFEVVRQAKAARMRAIVLKNHYTMTADRAELAEQEIGGIEVFGGITLNRSVGGLNPEAVRKMVQMDGRRGRVVWLPTFDSEAQVKAAGENRPFVSVVKDGQVVPDLKEIIGICAQEHLILAMGHVAASESLVILPEAKQAGVMRLLVTHAMSVPGGATDEQLKQMAALGAYVEMTWLATLPGSSTRPTAKGLAGQVSLADYVRVIRMIGAEHVLISSDMGQMQRPTHVAAMRAFVLALQAGGLSDAETDLVARKNSAGLLGLEG